MKAGELKHHMANLLETQDSINHMKFSITCDFAKVTPKLFDCEFVIEQAVSLLLTSKDYSHGIQEYILAYKVFPECMMSEDIKRDYSNLQKKSKRLMINPIIDYASFTNSNEQKRIMLIANEILKGIKRFEELGVKNFSNLMFYKDVEKLFESKGWINTSTEKLIP